MPKSIKFNHLLPELLVSDFIKSLYFYTVILGFKIEYQRKGPSFAFLSYQGSQLMIQKLSPEEKENEKLERPFGRGINFQIETSSVVKIIKSLQKHKYPVTRDIKDNWYKGNNILYGCREILVKDPDGYLLRFSEDLGKKSIK